jgi:hypothetical protein
VHTAIREHSKGFRYGFLFGMGPPRAGHIIYNTTRAVNHIDVGNGLQQQFFGGNGRPNETALKRAGKQALDKFITGTPGLRRLRAKLTCHVEDHGWLRGLDGRRVPVDAQYKALNFQVSSAEAVLTKRWLVRVFDELQQKFRYGWDGDCVITLWVHDEIAVCCRPEIAKQVGEIMVKHAKEPGEFYKFKVPLDADYKIGRSWAGEAIKPTAPPQADYRNEINAGLRREGIEPINWSNSDAGHDLGNPRRQIDTCVSDGDEPHPQVHREDSARLAVASEVFRTPENGIDPAPDQRTDLKEQTATANTSSYTHRTHGNNGPKQGRSIATWIYAHPNQPNYLRVDKHVLASGERRFYQHHRNGRKWIYGVKNTYAETKIPYRLPELIAALPTEPVWICEGEKDTDNVVALGLLATTNPGGAKVFQPELAQWFKGKEIVYILEDNDEAGRGHTAKITAALAGIVPSIAVVRFPDVPDKGDISDWLELGGTKKLLLARAAQALKESREQHELESVCASSIEIQVYDWLWSDRFAIGEIGLIVGMPDEGKGQMLAYIAGRVTRGLEWPNNEGCAPPGNVILLTAEDDIKKTVVPRLKAAGADLNRIEIVKMMHDRDAKDSKPIKRMFSLITDLDRLREKIIARGNVKLVEIDPVSAYLGLGKVDSYRTSDVRAVLGPLKDLAEELAVGIIGIMHFNKKVDVTNVLLRVSDSLAFVAAPRHVFGVIDDPDNGRKLVVRAKNNLTDADQKKKSLAFHFDVKQVGVDARNDKPIHAPFIAGNRDMST